MSVHRRDGARGPSYDVRYRAPDGSERSQTFRTRAEARAFEAAQRTQRARGAWIDPRAAATSFKRVADDWLQSKPAKRPSTLARDEIDLRHRLLPAIGERAIGSITSADVQALVNGWSADAKPRTVARAFGTMRAVFNFAVDRELIRRSPCRGIKLPAVEPVERTLIDGDQLAALVHELGQHGLMVYLGALLGLRWGEVAGLRVGRVDFDAATLTVSEQVTRGRDGGSALGPPKSHAGRRTLAISAGLAELIRCHIDERGVAGDRKAFLFSDRYGFILTYSNWLHRIWQPACKRAGLEGFSFHDLRRMNATGLVAEGVDIKTAQHRLGHSDPRLTLGIYAQVTTEGDRDAADRLSNRFLRANPTPPTRSI